ncbi:MAG: hypothetical protein HKP16_06900 [Xanthomonadales bacterium]|nr:hypothetical protein [Xanthomonadales bacterium]NNK31912.1 hypothetical protein [Xanthomonadales bacterium]
MIKKIVLASSIAGLSTFAHAAPPPTTPVSEGSMDLVAARQQMSAVRASMAASEEDVGDVQSFGRDKTYLGVVSTDSVTLQADCSGVPPDSGICIETNPAPGATSVDETDLGVINLPAKATNSLLCFTVTQFSTWIWQNSTAAQATGDMSLYVTVQIENDALLGLADADGNPFNGTLFDFPNPIVVSTQQSSLPPGAFELQRERTTRSCTGGFVSARSLAAEGLTDAQIKDFFNSPMTVRFGTSGNVSLVDIAIFFAGIRLYGD